MKESSELPSLIIRSRSDAGARWLAQFSFISAREDDTLSTDLTEKICRGYPKGTIEKYNVTLPIVRGGIAAAVESIQKRVRHWPIHWMRFANENIRSIGNCSPIGINDDEVVRLREKIGNLLGDIHE